MYKRTAAPLLVAAVAVLGYICDLSHARAATEEPKPIRFRIAFTKPVHSKEIDEGAEIEGVLKTPIKSDDDVVIAPIGSTIYGRIDRLVRSNSLSSGGTSVRKRLHVHSQLVLSFNRIVLPDNSELDLVADAIEQNSVFSNGEVIREIEVGPGGTLIKAFDTELYHNIDFGIIFPESWAKVRDRMQVDLEPGDQITLEATVPAHVAVSAHIYTRGKQR